MSDKLDLDSFDLEALRIARPSPEELDQISLQIAKGYLDSTYSFTEADTVMNDIYVYLTHSGLLTEAEVITWDVYLAFDAGEFHHRGDDLSEDPRLKYTKPLLEIAVKKYTDCRESDANRWYEVTNAAKIK
ncbi:hypothetical protein AAKU67_004486 [Oxalobacteraceae bacterium GrIS 2.11]